MMNILYNNSISDGGNGLYVTINIEEHDGIVHGSSVLHILPRDNENGFIIVSHTKYLPQHDISINLNGQELYCEQKPIILEGCTLAPLRAIFEAFNFTVTYDTDFENFKYIITAINDKSKLQLKFDKSYEYTPNAINSHWLIYYTPKGKASKRLEFNVAPLIINGCTLVPVRVIAEALGADVSWNENTKQVTINGNIPNKWNKAENLNELSYNDLYTLIKSYCDKNGITSKSPMDLFDFEHGKGVLVSYGDSEKSYGISYYSDGYIEQNAAISLEQAHQKGKEIMQTEYLSECEKEGILKNWDEGIWNDYYKYENGEYWSENDNAYLIGYYAGHCWSGYAINKYLNEVTAMGLYQDLWETIIPGFYIKK